MTEGWCNGLIKDFKVRGEQSRIQWCGGARRIRSTPPFSLAELQSKPPGCYIVRNMPLPDHPASDQWCSDVLSHILREMTSFTLHRRNYEEVKQLMRAEGLFVGRHWQPTGEWVKLFFLLADLSAIWLSWVKELRWQSKMCDENVVGILFSICVQLCLPISILLLIFRVEECVLWWNWA